ncbi:hypothetical protein RRF57_003369 [Xylaria bambusicola]|uniref:Uncharacterized protein n=1 Tax=Xylaria bambusicola TaxID=326684 RepID=A0AAN7UEN1_9PEZI
MNHSETETNARDLEEGKVAESSAYQIRNGGPEHKRNRIAGGRQDHKDSLNRYIRVGDTEKYQDHFLNPDDGKLVLLRVQCAKDYNRDSSLVTSGPAH